MKIVKIAVFPHRALNPRVVGSSPTRVSPFFPWKSFKSFHLGVCIDIPPPQSDYVSIFQNGRIQGRL